MFEPGVEIRLCPPVYQPGDLVDDERLGQGEHIAYEVCGSHGACVCFRFGFDVDDNGLIKFTNYLFWKRMGDPVGARWVKHPCCFTGGGR